MTTMSYQEQQMLQAVTGRAAILDLTARQNRAYSDGDISRWIATFRHSGASYTRDGELFHDLRLAFDGGDGQRLVTVDHEIHVDGVHASQRCVAVLFAAAYGDTTLRATGTFRDELIYERGGWYYSSRVLAWDQVPSRHPLVM
jgi:SnoaL-like domain